MVNIKQAQLDQKVLDQVIKQPVNGILNLQGIRRMTDIAAPSPGEAVTAQNLGRDIIKVKW